MPTNNFRVTVNLDPAELYELRKQARESESDSNLIRRLLKLRPLTHGGSRAAKTKKAKK